MLVLTSQVWGDLEPQQTCRFDSMPAHKGSIAPPSSLLNVVQRQTHLRPADTPPGEKQKQVPGCAETVALTGH